MKKTMLAMALLLLLSGLWTAAARAEAEAPEGPALNAEGFLDEGEYVREDEENGYWEYASPTLHVVINRRYTTDPVPLYWWEADIRTRGGERWFMPTAVEGKHLSVSRWPYLVAQRNKVVFAINNDYAQGRYPSRNNSVGIIIRDGRILWSKTRRSQSRNAFPNLDIMAFMPDGSFEVFDYNAHTAEEYLDMGVENLLCFGPWLIRDGEVNEVLDKVGQNRNPRTVIGMVENGHYAAIVSEGRSRRSKGCTLRFMTDRLLEMGCTVGFNLDGGETSFMTFMGVQLNLAGGANNRYGSARRASDIVAIGVSDLVVERTPTPIK